MLGLAGTVALRPAAVFLGAVLGVFDPRLRSGVLAYGSQEMLSNSLFRSGYELLYTPLPEGEKRPTKAVVDVGFDKLGALLGGATVLVVVAVAPTAALRVLAGLVALLSLGTLALTRPPPPRLREDPRAEPPGGEGQAGRLRRAGRGDAPDPRPDGPLPRP